MAIEALLTNEFPETPATAEFSLEGREHFDAMLKRHDTFAKSTNATTKMHIRLEERIFAQSCAIEAIKKYGIEGAVAVHNNLIVNMETDAAVEFSASFGETLDVSLRQRIDQVNGVERI